MEQTDTRQSHLAVGLALPKGVRRGLPTRAQLRCTSLLGFLLTGGSELGPLQFAQTTLERMGSCPHFAHKETEAPGEEIQNFPRSPTRECKACIRIKVCVTLRSKGTRDSNPEATPRGYISPASQALRRAGHVPFSLPPAFALSLGQCRVGGGRRFSLPPTDIDGPSDYCKCYGVV